MEWHMLILFCGLLSVALSCKPIKEDDDPEPTNRTETKPPPPERVICQVREVTCPMDESYPNLEGLCNNKKHPTWGAAKTPLKRLLPAAYDDGVESPRQTSKCGLPLPSTRLLSNKLHDVRKSESQRISHLHVLWGQLLAHDIVHTPVTKRSTGQKLDCNCVSPDKQCFNVMLPSNDEQTLSINKTCIPVERSKPAEGIHNCTFSQRQQLTTMSAVIDGTMLYGKNDQELSELRNLTSDAGLLLTREHPNGGDLKLLPTQDQLPKTSISNTTDCRAMVHRPSDVPCFVAGDVRNNENSGLISIQTVLLRFHQRLAMRLKNANPSWTSDRILFTNRQIISAILQRITYTEYLPLLVGTKFMKRYDLNILEAGHWYGYDDTHNPTISNSFTTAAFRYGHSQVAASLSRPGKFFDKDTYPSIPSKESFFNSEPILNKTGGGVGSIMRGFMLDKAESTDTTIIDDMRNQLFTIINGKFGNDLFAINVQRGRDHGLPGYNEYRVLCGLNRAYTFSCLSGEMSESKIRKLQSSYRSVDDIDLYVGGLSENQLEDAEVGPTFACLLANQFRALRRGDQYWHENPESPTPLTAKQLKAVRSYSFRNMLCETGDNMMFVTPNPLAISELSSIIPCSQLKELDIEPWKEGASTAAHDKALDWSVWFPTDQTFGREINIDMVLSRLQANCKSEVCTNVTYHEIRKLPHDQNAQVRFRCPAGEIRATDFPHEISDKSYFTRWMKTKHMKFAKGFELNMAALEGQSAIAIQARRLDDGVFARETGDVFKEYNVINGFACRHIDQECGACPRYEVRFLVRA